MPSAKITDGKPCPYCKSRHQHKRACPLNPFNKSKKKFDTEGIYEFAK